MNYLVNLLLRCAYSPAARAELRGRWQAATHSAATAINEQALEEGGRVVFTNHIPFTHGDEWSQVAPWGEHPNVKGVQVTTPATVAPMITAFNAEKDRRGKNFRGVPIYDRHPTRDELRAGLRPLGRVMGMEARNDGLYVQRTLTSEGAVNDKEGLLPFPSIGWVIRPIGNGKVAPVSIDHVAMVEHPNIGDVPAWTNSEPEVDPPAKVISLTKLALSLGLAESASLEECEAAAEAITLLAENEKDRADDLDEELKSTHEHAADSVIQVAVNEGRITHAQKDEWKAKLITNAATAADLMKLKQRINTTSLALNRGSSPVTMARTAASEKLAALATEELKKNPRLGLIKAHNIACLAHPELVKAANGDDSDGDS